MIKYLSIILLGSILTACKTTEEPMKSKHHSSGIASYYWQPQKTANGEQFNPNAMTAAHKTLPFGTKVRVTNSANGKSVIVRINDRGPFIKGRIIDVSKKAAQELCFVSKGLTHVSLHKMEN